MLREFSAGGVVFKKENNKVLWLVTCSAPSALYPESFWRLPKGWLDDEDGGKRPGQLSRGEKKATDSELKSAALREVREEGGVEAGIIKKIGTDKYVMSKEGGSKAMKFVTYYLMEYVKDLPEGPDFETSEVRWLPFPEARKILTHSSSKVILDKAKELLI